MMKHVLKFVAPPATAMFAMAFFATATPAAAASAADYCRTDVSSGMRGCGYASLEQCQSMSSGRGGSCFENPFPSGSTNTAFAYQPKHHASKSATRHVKRPVED